MKPQQIPLKQKTASAIQKETGNRSHSSFKDKKEVTSKLKCFSYQNKTKRITAKPTLKRLGDSAVAVVQLPHIFLSDYLS